MAESDKIYILNCRGNKTRKVTIPCNWKVTFGPLVPGSKSEQRPVMRIYEGANKEMQRAIFTDVESFREISIPVLEKVTKRHRKTMRKQTPEGDKDFVVEARETEWRDPDQEDVTPDEEFLNFPTADELRALDYEEEEEEAIAFE